MFSKLKELVFRNEIIINESTLVHEPDTPFKDNIYATLCHLTSTEIHVLIPTDWATSKTTHAPNTICSPPLVHFAYLFILYKI